MGLCGSSGAGGGGAAAGLAAAQKRDLQAAAPVCRALGIRPKEMQQFLENYEETIKNGQGRGHRALRLFRVDHLDYTYFKRTLLYYDVHGNEVITFPQFVATVWHFASLDATGLANWSFRVFFGGKGLDERAGASQEEVFHMLDVMYGLSKEFDFNPNLEAVEMVGNSSEYDVKRTKGMISKIAGKDGVVSRGEFVKLVKKTPAMLMRIISTQNEMRNCVCGPGFWRRMEGARDPRMDLDKLATQVERQNPALLWVDGKRRALTSSSSSPSTGGGDGSNSSSNSSSSKYAVKNAPASPDAERRRMKKSRLDEEEDKAALKMQTIMRAKKDRKKVRRKRAEQQQQKRLEELLAASAPGTEAAATPPPNPNGDWVEAWDAHYQAVYYYNMATEECVWEAPPGFVPSGQY